MSTRPTATIGLGGADLGAAPAKRALGGKGAALAELGEAGARVPRWFCVASAVFAPAHARVLEELGRPSGDRGALRAWGERARAIVVAHGLDARVREAIAAAFEGSFSAEARVAVRSSAVGEDSARDSFAGQLDTFLYVPRGGVEGRIVDVVASAYSERALAYRARRGSADIDVAVAVLVQEMVDGRASGVLFTANPTTSDRGEGVVAAGLGLGEGVVSGRVETDTFFLSAEGGRVRQKKIVAKRERVSFDALSGTRVEPVEGEAATEPAITDGEAEALFAIGRALEAHFGAPQDVEWTIDHGGAIHVLQSRPITTLERETIFDSSNIVESFPGLTLPLTFTFARSAYEEAFREAQRRTGVPVATLEEHAHVHANLIGLVEGRVYYNILNWYRLFTWVPGFEGMLPAWEKALGLDRRFVPPARPARGLRDRAAQARVIESNLRRFVVLQRDVEAFLATLAAVQEGIQKTDLDALDPHQILERLDDARHRLLRPFAVSVTNDLYAQQLYDRLSKLIATYGVGDPTTLRNELLCGEQGMESVAPVRSLVEIAQTVRRTPALARAFEAHDDASLARRLRDDETLAPLARALDAHLRLYGDRTLEELKLETPPLSERPEFLLAMVRNYVRGKLDVARMESRERAIRARAEEAVKRALAGSPLRARIFAFTLDGARRLVRNREALRLARSRAYGIVRALYRALARKLVARGVLRDAQDLFYLTTEEVDGLVRGGGVTRDFAPIVQARREEWIGHARRRPTPRVTVRGPVGAARIDQDLGRSASPARALQGIPCSPGRKVARAKVVLDPTRETELGGEILVAPMTDPAWAYLMVAAGGLVAERGSILSHTAIIGRELGIPTVVAVAGATEMIASGERIEIDGTAGTVRLLDAAETDAPDAQPLET